MRLNTLSLPVWTNDNYADRKAEFKTNTNNKQTEQTRSKVSKLL